MFPAIKYNCCCYFSWCPACFGASSYINDIPCTASTIISTIVFFSAVCPYFRHYLPEKKKQYVAKLRKRLCYEGTVIYLAQQSHQLTSLLKSSLITSLDYLTLDNSPTIKCSDFNRKPLTSLLLHGNALRSVRHTHWLADATAAAAAHTELTMHLRWKVSGPVHCLGNGRLQRWRWSWRCCRMMLSLYRGQLRTVPLTEPGLESPLCVKKIKCCKKKNNTISK